MIVPAIRYHKKKSVDVSVTYDNRDSLDKRNVCVLINKYTDCWGIMSSYEYTTIFYHNVVRTLYQTMPIFDNGTHYILLKLLKRSIQIWIQCFVWYIIWLYDRGGIDIFLILFIFCYVIITTFGYNNDITVYCVILFHGLNSTNIVLLVTTWHNNLNNYKDKFITNNKEMSSIHSHIQISVQPFS